MAKNTPHQQEIVTILLQKDGLGSSAIHAELLKTGEAPSLVTIKRALARMVIAGTLAVLGAGRATAYTLTTLGRLQANVNPREYVAIEPDQRYGLTRYNFQLFPDLPTDIFSEQELTQLEQATAEYTKRTTDSPPAIQKRELERLIIELSWKSSKIEGNTYTLLDTEKLLLEHKEAPGHDKQEARMILNHKDAFTFIYENSAQFTALTLANLETLHKILVKGLSVGFGLRKKPVGVVGSKYSPLDNIHQITEATQALCRAVEKMTTSYAKALVALLGISYIQPFEDGNKRTARLAANALLLAHGAAPLSYRSIDENDYRAATLVFYELNSIAPFKKLFIDQYDFAARNYAVKPT